MVEEARSYGSGSYQVDAHDPVAGVVPVTGVGNDPPVQPRGVVEQVQYGDLRRGLLVRELELGNIPAYRRVQIDVALRREAHQRRGREGLRDRAHKEQRVLVDGQRVVDAPHAVA